MTDTLPIQMQNGRTVTILNNPADMSQGSQQYDIDLQQFMEIEDDNVDLILSAAPAYRMTLRWYAWVSKMTLQGVEASRLQWYTQRTGESKTHIINYLLPTDHDWCAWKGQYEWLKYAYEFLSEVLEAARTYSANRRPENRAHYHPGQSQPSR